MAYQRAEKAAFLNEYLYNYRKVSSSADRRFRPDIEETFENLLKHTYEFLEQDTSLSGKDTCYTGLVYDCMARALEKSLSIGKIRQASRTDFTDQKICR